MLVPMRSHLTLAPRAQRGIILFTEGVLMSPLPAAN